jgi:hypothetical protein
VQLCSYAMFGALDASRNGDGGDQDESVDVRSGVGRESQRESEMGGCAEETRF